MEAELKITIQQTLSRLRLALECQDNEDVVQLAQAIDYLVNAICHLRYSNHVMKAQGGDEDWRESL